MYVRLFEHPNVVLTRPSSTPAMSSRAQRQVPEFTAGRLSHRNPHGSHRSTRGCSQILCRVIGSRSYERGMLGDHTYVVFSFFFQAVWKRRISIFRRTGKIDKTVHELSQYLDTFYTDVEGWLELADIYASSNQYASIPMTSARTDELARYEYSLQSLMHVLLLAPQNPFYVLQAAETAYTAGDLALSIKMFLMVVDMTDGDDSESLVESTPLGITVRAWYGVKLVSVLARYFRSEKAMVTSCSVRNASPRMHGWRQALPPIRPLRKTPSCSTSLQRSDYGLHTRVLDKRVGLPKGERKCLLGWLPLDLSLVGSLLRKGVRSAVMPRRLIC